MKLKYRALAFAATALVLGHGAWAGEAEEMGGQRVPAIDSEQR